MIYILISRARDFTTLLFSAAKLMLFLLTCKRFSVLFKTLTFVLLWRTSVLTSTTNSYGTFLHITSSFHCSRNLIVKLQR